MTNVPLKTFFPSGSIMDLIYEHFISNLFQLFIWTHNVQHTQRQRILLRYIFFKCIKIKYQINVGTRTICVMLLGNKKLSDVLLGNKTSKCRQIQYLNHLKGKTWHGQF